MRPLIGIPCHADYLDGSRRPVYCNNRAYVHAIEHAGGVPILIPILHDFSMLDTLLPRLDGLLLSGGADIDPAVYGEAAHPLCDTPDHELDEIELKLASWALQEDIPTLGVCRGMQVLNVALGGTLYQDIDDQRTDSLHHSQRQHPRDFLAHSINVLSGSRVQQLLGPGPFMVNSLHHQAVRQPGRGVVISGKAGDGIAEMLEVSDHRFVVAAQFHPEEIYMKESTSARLFAGFVQACSIDAEVEIALEREMASHIAG
ncbi:MAG TPA: gamma-glutamyl-gamma-aminobutyrate hydrolase family protein [Ktedonobacteraceae bacterium]|nr:gamma-glutamyl-gamma-aminobutyrate hydrolase family protein [Ktedonobacteraceae bacterium]